MGGENELTLHSLATQQPERFGNAGGNGFPLLLKMLYPREKLSVQVHPDDALAWKTLQEPRGKTECWYIVAAEPHAAVAVGFAQPIAKADVLQAIEDGTLEAKLQQIPVRAGDMVFVEAGTIHAIGPGMVVLEIQQYSDVTYRLWDYNRGRDLHIEAGMAALRTETAAGLVKPVTMESFDRLVSCSYFTVDRFKLYPGSAVPLAEAGKFQILVALGPGAQLKLDSSATPLEPGKAVLLPSHSPQGLVQSQAAVELIRVLGPGA